VRKYSNVASSARGNVHVCVRGRERELFELKWRYFMNKKRRSLMPSRDRKGHSNDLEIGQLASQLAASFRFNTSCSSFFFL